MNCEYLGPIEIGTPAVTFDVIYDTGSSLTWINSKLCTDVGCVHGLQYDHSQSSSFKSVPADKEVFEFGSGNITAALAQDKINLQGLVLKKGKFYEILKQDGDDFKDGNFEGIVGLGYPQNSMRSIFDDIMEELPQKVFSTYLTRDDQSSSSKLILGGVDESLYTGKIHYYDVITNDQYWIIQVDKIKIGKKDTKICEKAGGCKAVLDTGTSFMTGPKDDLQLILNSLNIDDQCSNYHDLPDITFQIGGVNYSLTPEEYIITITRQTFPDELFTHSDDSQITGCVGIFADMDIPQIDGSAWIFGDVFISKFYTVFDRANNQIGLATAKQQ